MKITMLVEFDLSMPKHIEYMADREKANSIIELYQTNPETIKERIKGQYVTVMTGPYKRRLVGTLVEVTVQ